MDFPVLRPQDGGLPKEKLFFNPLWVDEPPSGYYLSYEEGQWVVRNQELARNFVIRLEFDKEVSKIIKQKISVRKDLLSKAVGLKKQDKYIVVDGTMGLAKDALHLVAQGAHIRGFEKNPIVATLLVSALNNSQLEKKSLSVDHQDIFEVLDDWEKEYDCLYLDPMFEQINQKAAPKKNMAFLRGLELQPEGFEKIIEKAYDRNVPRIVVKRPVKAGHLYEKPNSIVEGKIVRYDIYIR